MDGRLGPGGFYGQKVLKIVVDSTTHFWRFIKHIGPLKALRSPVVKMSLSPEMLFEEETILTFPWNESSLKHILGNYPLGFQIRKLKEREASRCTLCLQLLAHIP